MAATTIMLTEIRLTRRSGFRKQLPALLNTIRYVGSRYIGIVVLVNIVTVYVTDLLLTLWPVMFGQQHT
jgi:hypothetical protein